MGVESISGVVSSVAASYQTDNSAKKNTEVSEKKTSDTTKQDQAGVIYEKNTGTSTDKKVTYDVSSKERTHAAIVAQMKADTQARTKQLQDIVSQMMQKQGAAIGTADDIWSFLASGNYTVTEAAKIQAQKDIAEDGYWGVEQTSERIVSFAKALTGDDSSKADEMLEAFKKGFKEATKSWGKDLPDISQRTYDAVIKKFDAWKNGTDSQTETTDNSNS
ncbi:MAG: hypothetical protein ACI4HI_12680 [Lachnospiraceae bacterium]